MREARGRPWTRAGGRARRALVGLGTLLVLLGSLLAAPAAPASAAAGTAGVSADRTQAAALEARIVADGANLQRLVASYDAAVTHQSAVSALISQDRGQLAADQKQVDAARANLRTLAVDAYMNGTATGGILADLTDKNVMSLLARQAYTRASGDNLGNAIDSLRLAEARTGADEANLRVEEDQASAVVRLLASDQASVQAEMQRDNVLLAQVKANLQGLLAAIAASQAAQRRQAAEEAAMAAAARRQEAAAAAAAAANAAASVPPAPVNPSPGQYADPLRDIQGLAPERVDQGVDYHGYGPIYAMGDGTVSSIVNSGWPGGTFICYRLTDGRASGLAVYAAEDIDPSVSVGQSVTPNTILGTMYEGPDGIETGWADPSCDGVSMANDAGQFSGGNSTAYGANYSQALSSFGAPPGIMQNNPPTGSLPPNWPTW